MISDYIATKRKELRANFFELIDTEIQVYIHRLLQVPWLATTTCCQGRYHRKYGHTDDTYGTIAYTYLWLYFDISLDQITAILDQVAAWHRDFGQGAYEFKLDYTKDGWRLGVSCSPEIRDPFLNKFCEVVENDL